MTRVYVDTSALLSLYQRHSRTEEVEAYCSGAAIVISRLALVEFRSAILKYKRRKEITLKQAREVIEAFRRDLRKYRIVEINYETWRIAGKLIEKHSPERDLRSLDAIQIAAALSLPTRKSVHHFVTLDLHAMANVAELEGLNVRP